MPACMAGVTLTCHRENAGGKDFTLQVSKETRSLKGFMKPVMKEWLTTGLGTSMLTPHCHWYIH
jgi:nuclear pore complex protein Nup107